MQQLGWARVLLLLTLCASMCAKDSTSLPVSAKQVWFVYLTPISIL
jgi:hypothetical protein